MNGDIIKLGNLSLSYKTFIGQKAGKNDLEICQWNEKNDRKWTIATFELSTDGDYYYLESCADRLNDKDIDWNTFGILVGKAYEILNNEE